MFQIIDLDSMENEIIVVLPGLFSVDINWNLLQAVALMWPSLILLWMDLPDGWLENITSHNEIAHYCSNHLLFPRKDGERDRIIFVDYNQHWCFTLSCFVQKRYKLSSLRHLMGITTQTATNIKSIKLRAELRRIIDRVHTQNCIHVRYNHMRTLLQRNIFCRASIPTISDHQK